MYWIQIAKGNSGADDQHIQTLSVQAQEVKSVSVAMFPGECLIHDLIIFTGRYSEHAGSWRVILLRN